jgi:hypothetical protein
MKFWWIGAVALVLCANVASADITDDETVQQAMITSEAAARVIVGCSTIGMDAGAMAQLVEELTAHVEGEGYSANEAAKIQSDSFRRRIARTIDRYIRNGGFDGDTPEGLCAFGASEIEKGTQIGQILSN